MVGMLIFGSAFMFSVGMLVGAIMAVFMKNVEDE